MSRSWWCSGQLVVLGLSVVPALALDHEDAAEAARLRATAAPPGRKGAGFPRGHGQGPGHGHGPGQVNYTIAMTTGHKTGTLLGLSLTKCFAKALGLPHIILASGAVKKLTRWPKTKPNNWPRRKVVFVAFPEWFTAAARGMAPYRNIHISRHPLDRYLSSERFAAAAPSHSLSVARMSRFARPHQEQARPCTCT